MSPPFPWNLEGNNVGTMLAAILYSVQILSLPRHSVAVLWPTSTQVLMEPVLYRRPSTVALASSCAAIVVRTHESNGRNGPERVVVDGDVLPFPKIDVLAPYFINPGARNLMSVRNLVLAQRGKPVIAVYDEVSGAYWAVQEASFAWDGSRWIPALPTASGMMPKNVWVAAADSHGGLGYVGDYLYFDPARLTNALADSLSNVAMIYRAQHPMVLGRGIITAMSANRTVGYDDGYVPGANGSTPVHAIEWQGFIRSVLGEGIAWSVNAQGDVVGDNRKTLKSVGVPMLWHEGRPIRLGDTEGTAFAIADNGTIVGDMKSHAFLIQPNDPSHHLIVLDDLVGGGWHISAAYYVAANGDILALASRKRAPSRLVLLRPLKR